MSDNIALLKDSSSNISNNRLQEINDLYMLLKTEKSKFNKNNVFLDLILESAKTKYGIVELLATKITDIILRGELIETIKGVPASLLDDFNTAELTFNEQEDLRLAIELAIKELSDSLLKELNDLSDNNFRNLEELVENLKFDTEPQKAELLQKHKQLTDQQKVLISKLLNLGTKLEELVMLKTESTKTTEQKAVEVTKKSVKNNLRSKILHQQARLSIFQELPFTLDAYRSALIELLKQQDAYKKEIDQLQNNKEKYKIISKNEEYREVLKEYKQYKRGLENKLWIHNELLKHKTS